MTPVHVLPLPAPRGAPLPVLTPRDRPSVYSGMILALILLALLLQASFFVGLAHGRLGGPEPVAAPPAALVR